MNLPGKPHKYSLSGHPEARQRAIWLIRDYPNIKQTVESIDGYSSGGGSDGGPRSTVPHSTVETAAIKRAAISWQVEAVEWAFDQTPQEYRAGIWSNIIDRKPYPDYANINTWKSWKQKLIYLVAWKAGMI